MPQDEKTQATVTQAESVNSGAHYYASYTVIGDHSCIVISRTDPNDPHKTVVLASFGLWARAGSICLVLGQAMLNGAIAQKGQVKSEHYYLDNFPPFSFMGKSFAITQQQADQVLDKVRKDAQSSQPTMKPKAKKEKKYELTLLSEALFNKLDAKAKKKPYLLTTQYNKYRMWGYKDNQWQYTDMEDNFKIPRKWANKAKVPVLPTDPLFQVLKKGHIETFIPPDFFNQLTPKEQEYYSYFRSEMSHSINGPDFNVRDFNCKKYAISILRYLGIKDVDIEKNRFPTRNFAGSKAINFNSKLSDLNVVEQYNDKANYPARYYKIYGQAKTPVEGALALLKDYAANSFKNSALHFKRHHKKEVRKFIADLELKIQKEPEKYNNVKSIVNHIAFDITPFRDMIGSLQNRLDFLLERATTSPFSADTVNHRQTEHARENRTNSGLSKK